jgi:superfamily II DNA or RNA helicase
VPKPLAIHTLRQFEARDIRILVSCKTLDEGLNIRDVDAGIVVSSTGSHRQRVQRLGRVLRKKDGNNKARFYYLYAEDTSEEEELLQEIVSSRFEGLVNRIDLKYNEEAGTFENQQYSVWENSIVENMIEKGHTVEEGIEFMRNADLGLLSEDWLMLEGACMEIIESAGSNEERNYYIAMLMIIRERKLFSKLNH